MADTLFNAKATLKEGLQVECTARDFSIILDEPYHWVEPTLA